MVREPGKTFLLALLFLIEAKKLNKKQIIIVGASIAAVIRNIIEPLEMWTGMKFKLGKFNDFKLFGNTVYIFNGADSASWKQIRGMTSSLTLFSEVTALHQEAVKEGFDRTSGVGARILADTNPENPYHFFKVEYIDKNGLRNDDKQLMIYSEHFTLLDNTTLEKNYVDRQLALYPVGSVDYNRNILGAWVAKEGIVFNSFNEQYHMIDSIPDGVTIRKYIAGVDWGFNHYGSILVCGIGSDNKFYIVDEVAEREKDLDWWKSKALELHDKYKLEVMYCDHAYPMYISAFKKVGLPARKAKKDVIEGITVVNSLLSTGHLMFIKGKFNQGLKEMYQYVWKGGTSEDVVKEYDDVLDSLRYVIFSELKLGNLIESYKNMKPIIGKLIDNKPKIFESTEKLKLEDYIETQMELNNPIKKKSSIPVNKNNLKRRG